MKNYQESASTRNAQREWFLAYFLFLGYQWKRAWQFWGFITKIMHFRHGSAEILSKNLRNLFVLRLYINLNVAI